MNPFICRLLVGTNKIKLVYYQKILQEITPACPPRKRTVLLVVQKHSSIEDGTVRVLDTLAHVYKGDHKYFSYVTVMRTVPLLL